MSLTTQFRSDYSTYKMRRPCSTKYNILVIDQGPFGMTSKKSLYRKMMPNHAWIFFTEMVRDLGYRAMPKRWQVEELERNGIMFISTTVFRDHKHKLFSYLSTHAKHCPKAVYILIGRYPQTFAPLLARKNHLVICVPTLRSRFKTLKHPFIGTAPFSKACEFLGVSKEIWRIS